jgi:hypothetical protein
MKNFLFLLIAFIPVKLNAQNCDCTANFDYMVKHVKVSYAGFNDKITTKNRKEFESFTKLMRDRAMASNNTDSCYVILKSWTNYFKDNHLRIQFDWKYRKKYPEVAKQLNKQFSKADLIPSATEKLETKTGFRILDSNTLLMRLPSFAWSEKKIIDSLLNVYEGQIHKKANLIIDLRGNDGGTDYAYNGLIPLIYSNPIYIKPDEYLSSPENIQILEESLNDKSTSDSAKEFLTRLIELMRQFPNQFVNPSGKENFEIKLDSIYKFPSKVAVLIDRNTASSAESFLLTAVQSKKVKVYGQNSAGILDYGNTQFFDIPCGNFNLVIPISRSKRLPD